MCRSRLSSIEIKGLLHGIFDDEKYLKNVFRLSFQFALISFVQLVPLAISIVGQLLCKRMIISDM